MKNARQWPYLLMAITLSFKGMDNKETALTEQMQQSVDSTLLKTIYLEAGATDTLWNSTNSSIIDNYDSRFPRKFSAEERRKLREDREKIAQNWRDFQIEGYVFGSSSELNSSEDPSSQSTDSFSSSSSAVPKDTLEPLYRVIERKKLDLNETKNQP